MCRALFAVTKALVAGQQWAGCQSQTRVLACRVSGVHGAGCNGIADALSSLHLLLRARKQLPCTGTGSGNQHPPSSQGAVDMETEQVAVAKDIDVRFVHFDWAGLADEAELPLWAVPRRALRGGCPTTAS